jgi:hypothetical protein
MKELNRLWLFILFAIVYMAFMFFCSVFLGCNVEKKAQRKASYLIAHDKLGEFCNLLYPPKPDSIVTRDTTVFDTIPGPQVTVYDTIHCKDSIIYREIKCPPAQVIVKHERHDSTIYRDNPNQRAAYEQQLREKDKQIKAKDDIVIKQQQKIDKNDWWRTAAIITWCVVLLGFVFRFFVFKRPI